MKVSEGIYRLNLYPGFSGGAWPVAFRNVKVGPKGATVDYRYTGFRVTGSVVGPNGDALTNADVGAFALIGTDYVSASSRTVAGRYSLLVPAGVYNFYVASGAYQDGLPRLTSNDVSIASDTTFDFALDGFTVSATFTLMGGTPMIGAGLSAVGDGVVAGASAGLD
ncbi:MAG TPA: hypothetical protein VJW75_11605, partial [Candidatus Eisenbacteria bacterium]|nr:hypothetical protein [Candidatus Eisenbacteria bacterium]